MKILFIVEHHHPHVGGVERVFKTLTEGLVKKGHECTVLTTNFPKSKRKETLNGVKIIRINTPPFAHRYWFSLAAIPKAIELAKKHDVIHTTTYTASLPARIASIATKKPAIITIHELFGRKWKTLLGLSSFSAWAHRFLEEQIVKFKFNRAATPSEYTRKFAISLGFNPRKILTIYNGVDYDHFNSKNAKLDVKKKLNLQKNFTILSFGRPGISKGIEYLVQAMPQIVRAIPEAKLLLLLSDSPKDRYNYIKGLIKKLNLKDHVLLKEPVPFNDLPSYIKSADCVVVPSISEGFGYTAAETCAIGTPLVVSDTASLPEVVSGKYTLVEPKNPLSIAHGVERVYKKKYNQTPLKKFTWQKFVDQYEKVYRDMVKK